MNEKLDKLDDRTELRRVSRIVKEIMMQCIRCCFLLYGMRTNKKLCETAKKDTFHSGTEGDPTDC